MASGENNETITDGLEPIDLQEAATTTDSDWMTTKPHEGEVLNGGYVGFKNKESGKYLTIQNGTAASGINVCQQSASSIANAQEFYLQYTYLVTGSLANFTIYPINSSGSVATNLRVKAGTISEGSANVSLGTSSFIQTNERWQIEHVVDNYYCIYIADNPTSASVKYALTAHNGSDSATPTVGALDNVYVAEYTGHESQLWQICADGTAMNINGYDILAADTGVIHEVPVGTELYYVPKAFNTTIVWDSVPANMLGIADDGRVSLPKMGEIEISLSYSSSSSSTTTKIVDLFIMPESGNYYIGNATTYRYMDVEGPSTLNDAIVQQWNFHTQSQEKWRITNDDDTVGYVRVRSRYSMKFLAVDPNDISVVKQTNVLDDYSLWKIETTVSGNVTLTCKALESSSKVLAVPDNSNSNGTNLTTLIYTNNANCKDEWNLFLLSPYTVNVTVLYDNSYNNRYQNAGTRIADQILILQEKYVTEFGITVNAIEPTKFDSYVDTNCSTNPTQACLHCVNSECENSGIYPSGRILLKDLHHTNITNVLLRVQTTDVAESMTVAYLGHVKCSVSTVKNDDDTTTIVHSNSGALGLTYVRIGLCGVMNFETIPSETKTMIHEFGHLYGVIDHYGGAGKSTEQMNEECQSDIYSEYCIYGEKRYDETVLSEYTICDGCKMYIVNNTDRYDH